MRWNEIKYSFSINESFIIKQYEEVIIKNQMLNVNFDDIVMQKNSKKIILEKQTEILQLMLGQVKTSSKLMVNKKIVIDNFRVKKCQFLNHLQLCSLQQISLKKLKILNKKQLSLNYLEKRAPSSSLICFKSKSNNFYFIQ